MGDDLFEEWDENFLDEVIHVSELATSSSTQSHPPKPSLNPNPQPPPAFPFQGAAVSYSPPRELSQKLPDHDAIMAFDPPFSGFLCDPARPDFVRNATLKRDAGRVVKHLNPREQSGQHVRKADVRRELPEPTFSPIDLKDTNFQRKYHKNLEQQAQDLSQLTSRFQNASSVNDHVASRIAAVTPTCKSVGIQTDKSESPAPLPIKNDKSTNINRRNKLLSTWDSPTGLGSQRGLVSVLSMACETDLRVLYESLNFSSKATTNSPVDQKSSTRSVEAEKISNLYSMLTKIDSGMVKLDALLEALVDLCCLDNDVILYRSLRIFHKALTHVTSLDARPNRRGNVIVKRPSSGNNPAESFGVINMHKKEPETHGYTSSSRLDWISVFELMSQIAARNTEETTRLEAVSTMNTMLIRTNAYVDRERFGRVVGFRTISQFLRKDSGLGVQKEAVHLLYLLLNCPKLMTMFCSGCKQELESVGNVNSDARNGSTVQEFGPILDGLAASVACSGNSMLELKLRRKSVTMLAFLASSGKLGFEIFLAQRLLKRSNYLALILQMLVSEMDAEVSNISESPEVLKERTLLMRETVIFLNRLVTNPQFSAPVLQVLTETRGTASLAVDVATRLSNKPKPCWQSDHMTRQMRESEIVELILVFKKRVFTYIENGSL